MSSLLTNTAAMTALQTLRSINANLATTQNRISTGYRVSTASDNAAYWSIATTMRSDVQALSAVQDALGLGAATIDTMYTGLNGTVRRRLADQGEAGCRPYAGRRSRQDPERNHRTAEAAEEHRRQRGVQRRKLDLGQLDLRELQRHEVGRVVVLPRRRLGQDRYALGQPGLDQALRREPGHRLQRAGLPDRHHGGLRCRDRRGRQHHRNGRYGSGHQHRRGREDVPVRISPRRSTSSTSKVCRSASTPPARRCPSRAATTPHRHRRLRFRSGRLRSP